MRPLQFTNLEVGIYQSAGWKIRTYLPKSRYVRKLTVQTEKLEKEVPVTEKMLAKEARERNISVNDACSDDQMVTVTYNKTIQTIREWNEYRLKKRYNPRSKSSHMMDVPEEVACVLKNPQRYQIFEFPLSDDRTYTMKELVKEEIRYYKEHNMGLEVQKPKAVVFLGRNKFGDVIPIKGFIVGKPTQMIAQSSKDQWRLAHLRNKVRNEDEEGEFQFLSSKLSPDDLYLKGEDGNCYVLRHSPELESLGWVHDYILYFPCHVRCEN